MAICLNLIMEVFFFSEEEILRSKGPHITFEERIYPLLMAQQNRSFCDFLEAYLTSDEYCATYGVLFLAINIENAQVSNTIFLFSCDFYKTPPSSLSVLVLDLG